MTSKHAKVADWPLDDRRALSNIAVASGRTMIGARVEELAALARQARGKSKAEAIGLAATVAWEDDNKIDDLGDHYLHKVLAGSTMRQCQTAYGTWIAFLQAHHRDVLDLPIAARFSRDLLDGHIEVVKTTRKASSVALHLVQLRMMCVRLLPRESFEPLRAAAAFWAAKDLSPDARVAYDRADQIFDEGVAMMKEASDEIRANPPRPGKRLELPIRNLYRNGLVLAMLATCPLRRGNFAGLRAGPAGERGRAEDAPLYIADRGDVFVIRVHSAIVKNGQMLAFHLPGELTPFLREYLRDVRPQYPGSEAHACLWCSSRRPAAIEEETMNTLCRSASLARLDVELTPRDIRRSAVTFCAINDPENLDSMRLLLGHRPRSRMVAEAYNQVKSTHPAAVGLDDLVEAFLGFQHIATDRSLSDT